MRFLIFIFLLSPFYSTIAQDLSQKYLDTLEDEALLTLFNEVSEDSIEAEQVARTYLKRARLEGDTIKMARGYDRLARIFHPEKNLRFADSVIALTENNPQITYPALGYSLKAYNYETIGDLNNSTKNYLSAYEYAQLYKNIGMQVRISNNLIYGKAVWGDKIEALNLQRKRDSIIQTPEYLSDLALSIRKGAKIELKDLLVLDQIVSARNFTFCYYQLNRLDSAELYIQKMNGLLKDYDWVHKEILQNWSSEAHMEVLYFKKHYKESLMIANKLLDDKLNIVSNRSVMNIYLFKALALKEINEKEKSFTYLKKADSIANELNVGALKPIDRSIYEELLNHYISNRDTIRQVYYLNKLVLIDSVLKTNYKFFESEMEKKLETPELIQEKQDMIIELASDNERAGKITFWTVFSLICTLGVLIYYVRIQFIYKKRFKELKDSLNKNKQDSKLSNSICSVVSNDIVDELLNKLMEFEEQKKFLQNDITLGRLSKMFQTNDNYLSRVINLHLGKNFSQYLHDLRLEFATVELLSQDKYRNYTIKAIAEECGYKNAESFSRAFYKKYGIYPSYYIRRIQE